MSNVRPNEYDGLSEDFRSHRRDKYIIDATKFNINFQAQIRQGLWWCFVNILHLDALRGDTLIELFID